MIEHSTGVRRLRSSFMGPAFGLALTFLAVTVAWTFFRAPTFSTAFNLIESMSGLHGIVIPSGLAFALRPLGGTLAAVGISFGHGSGTLLVKTYLWVFALLSVAFLAPSSQEILGRSQPVLSQPRAKSLLLWARSPQWAMAVGALVFLGIISINHVSEFLYWQF